MGKGIAIFGIWLAIGICAVYAPKSVDNVSAGAVIATFIVSICSFE